MFTIFIEYGSSTRIEERAVFEGRYNPLDDIKSFCAGEKLYPCDSGYVLQDHFDLLLIEIVVFPSIACPSVKDHAVLCCGHSD